MGVIVGRSREEIMQPYLDRYMQGEQDRQQRDAQQKQLQTLSILKQWSSLPDDVRAQSFDQLPPEVKQLALNPNALPQHTPTAGEQLQATADQDALKQFPTLPQSVRQESAYRRANNADTPAEMTKGLAANDVYSNPSSFAPQMQPRQQIEDKTAPTGQESWTNQNVTLPTSKANIGHINSETASQYATADKTKAQTNQITTHAGDGDGGADPVVQNWVAAVKAAAAQGVDPNVVLKKIKDKTVAAQVGNELAKPETASLLAQSPIGQAQKTALAELDPIIQQTRNVIAALEPYKDKNGLTDRMTLDYAKYKAGVAPDDNTPAANIANLQMLGVQAGARLLKGGSRAYPALQMAMQHAPNAAVDTYKNSYDKAQKLLQQLENVRKSQTTYGQPLTAAPEQQQPVPTQDAASQFLAKHGY